MYFVMDFLLRFRSFLFIFIFIASASPVLRVCSPFPSSYLLIDSVANMFNILEETLIFFLLLCSMINISIQFQIRKTVCSLGEALSHLIVQVFAIEKPFSSGQRVYPPLGRFVVDPLFFPFFTLFSTPFFSDFFLSSFFSISRYCRLGCPLQHPISRHAKSGWFLFSLPS